MAEDNVVILDCNTRIDIPTERVLNSALECGMQDVVILGYDLDGEFYFASSKADGGHVLWLMAMAQKKLLEIGE